VEKKIAVLGTGANGAGIGADLTRAGLDVVFIEQWPAHVEAMRAQGIRVEMPNETTVTPVRAFHLCDVATLREKFDLVFVLMKAYDTLWSCHLIEPLLKEDGLVVGLQNGMTVDAIAAAVGAHRTIGGVVGMASNMYDPGAVVRQTPPSESWFAVGGIDPATRGREQEVVDVLRHAGTVEISDDIRSSKWMKLVVNAAELVPSAILDLPLAEAAAVPGMRPFMDENAIEAMEAALGSGNQALPILGLSEVELPPREYAVQLLDVVLSDFSRPDTKTTVLQDWLKGRRSEVHDVNGLVVREQQRRGGSAPANARTVEVARRIESGELAADRSNVDLLVGAGIREA